MSESCLDVPGKEEGGGSSLAIKVEGVGLS